jgi:outer membrane protein
MKEKELAYQKKFRDYQILVKDSNEELQAKDQELSKKMLPEILKLVQAIGEKEKFSMIIDVGQIPVAYYSKENDLTKRVIEEFNKTYKPKK